MTVESLWKIDAGGTYEAGVQAGRAAAERFLQHMGSGKVSIKNNELAETLASWEAHYAAANEAGAICSLNGQKAGFLARLSEFLAEAAFALGCGLNEENGFDPARISPPQG